MRRNTTYELGTQCHTITISWHIRPPSFRAILLRKLRAGAALDRIHYAQAVVYNEADESQTLQGAEGLKRHLLPAQVGTDPEHSSVGT